MYLIQCNKRFHWSLLSKVIMLLVYLLFKFLKQLKLVHLIRFFIFFDFQKCYKSRSRETGRSGFFHYKTHQWLCTLLKISEFSADPCKNSNVNNEDPHSKTESKVSWFCKLWIKIRYYFTTDGKLGYKGTKMAWFDHNKVMQHMWCYHNNIQSFFYRL